MAFVVYDELMGQKNQHWTFSGPTQELITKIVTGTQHNTGLQSQSYLI